MVAWDVTVCKVVDRFKCSRVVYWFHLQGETSLEAL